MYYYSIYYYYFKLYYLSCCCGIVAEEIDDALIFFVLHHAHLSTVAFYFIYLFYFVYIYIYIYLLLQNRWGFYQNNSMYRGSMLFCATTLLNITFAFLQCYFLANNDTFQKVRGKRGATETL